MPNKGYRNKTFKERYSPRIPFKPYLTHPLGRPAAVEEGYIYTQAERSIHGYFFHRGIDYAAKYGAPVYASASGYAVAGYHRFAVRNADGTLRMYKRKPLANGLGYFVQIYHPRSICGIEGGRLTQYGHLSGISSEIEVKRTEPVEIDIVEEITNKNRMRQERSLGEKDLAVVLRRHNRIIERHPWVTRIHGASFTDEVETRESYMWALGVLKQLFRQGNPYVTWVEQGQEIGRAGTSSVFYGEVPYDEKKIRPHIKPFPNTWDETHLHFEEAARDAETGLKIRNRDPYDIYKSKRWYESRYIRRSLFIPVPV